MNESSLKEPLKETEEVVEKRDSVEAENGEPRGGLFRALRGYLLILAFAFCVSVNGILLKKSFTLSGSDCSSIRFLLQFVIMFAIAKYKRISILGPSKQRKLLALRSLSGVIAMLSGFFAIKFINPSDMKVINHSNLIFTAILARLFLNEKLTVMHIVTFLLTVTGVVFIAQPGFLFGSTTKRFEHVNNTRNSTVQQSHQIEIDESIATSVGVSLAMIGAIGAGSSRVILKKLCMNKVHFVLPIIYSTYLGLPLSFLISTILTLTGVTHKHFAQQELPHLPLHLLYTTCAALIGIFAQVLLNLALNYEDATKLGITKTVDVFFAFLLQYIFLNIKVNLFSVLGAIAILIGAILLLIFKIIEEQLNKRKRKAKIPCSFIFVKF